ncbi:MAG: molybdopterin-dependent oxidoreductase [Ardenticatenaceae bacterium]|nr:molybdopterin-dependent oxidoreductase [Ardenticatenaceae bacterium]
MTVQQMPAAGLERRVVEALAASDQRIVSMCGICDAACGVEVYLKDGIIERIAPLTGHPRGSCCPRGTHSPEVVYSEDRLLYPIKRVGPKGTAAFERIGWDEALDTIVGRMRQVAGRHGPEAICMYTGRGNFEQSLCDIFAPAGTNESSASSLFFAFGSPNTTGVGAICYVAHGMIAPQATFGAYTREMFNDVDQAELIVVWGANPATDSPPIMLKRIKRARRRGAKVIVIDHQPTQTAKATDARWVGIRPGTDGALALSMIQVLIEEQLYDREFVENWTLGFDELRDYVQQFPPEVAETITWVPAEIIREVARAIAAARGAAQVMYTGLEYANSGVQNIRAAMILWALAGQLDVAGGMVFKMPGTDFRAHTACVAPPTHVDPVGKNKYPLYHRLRNEAHAMELPRAILEGDPYPIRAMLIGGSSIITAYPQPDLWRRCFEALDFLAVVDRFLTADALYADIVLPATTMFEIESYRTYGPHIQHRQRVIAPRGEARNDYLIYAELARRFGYGHLYPQSERELLEFVLHGTGVDLETLRANPAGMTRPAPAMVYRKWEPGLLRRDGRPGFETPSGKFEIASTLLASHGYEALPVYTEPTEGPITAPDVAATYPLVFNSGARVQSDFRSQHHNIPGLLAMQPEPLVVLHPRDAATRGIADGDAVFVVSPRGRVPFKARVTEDILPGVIEASAGGGGAIAASAWRRSNVNELTDPDNRDPISGFPVYKALLCDVVKAPPSARMTDSPPGPDASAQVSAL